MYSWEIQKAIEENNHYIGGDLLLLITDPFQNPQLDHIKYNPYNNLFEMWDKEGQYFWFTPMPYEEAINKGLVKSLKK